MKPVETIKDWFYDNPFSVVFLAVLGIALGRLLNHFFFTLVVLSFLFSLKDKRLLVAIVVFSLATFVLYKDLPVCHSGKYSGRVIEIKEGSHLGFLIKTHRCKFFLFAPKRYDNIKVGDKVIFYAKLKSIDRLKNGSFAKYLFSIGVNYVGFVRYIKRQQRKGFFSFGERVREFLETAFYYFLPSRVEYFINSAFLGDTRFKSRIKDEFINTQTAHIMAVSGVHMGFVFGMFYSLFYQLLSFIPFVYRRFNLKVISSVFAIPPVVFYFFVSGMHIPAIRSFLMMLIFIFALIFPLRRSSLNILFVLASVFVVFNLRVIFNPSFVMSFLMTAFAIVIFSVVGKVKYQLIRWSLFMFLMSVFAMPISAYYFNQISLLSFLSNSVIVPLFGFVIVPVSFLLSVSSVLPYGLLKIAIFKMGAFVVEGFLGIVSFFSRISSIVSVNINFATVGVIYLFLLLGLFILDRLLLRLNSQSRTLLQSSF